MSNMFEIYMRVFNSSLHILMRLKNVALALKLLQQWLLHVRLHVTARPAVRIPLLILLNEF